MAVFTAVLSIVVFNVMFVDPFDVSDPSNIIDSVAYLVDGGRRGQARGSHSTESTGIRTARGGALRVAAHRHTRRTVGPVVGRL